MSKKKPSSTLVVKPTLLPNSNTSMLVTDNVMQDVQLNVSLDTNDLVALYVTEYDAALKRKGTALQDEKSKLQTERNELNNSDEDYDYKAAARQAPEGVAFIDECKAAVKAMGHAWKEDMISCDNCTRMTTTCRMHFAIEVPRRKHKMLLSSSTYVYLKADPKGINPRLKAMDAQIAEIDTRINKLNYITGDRDKERNARAIITKLKLASMSNGKVNMPELIAKLQEGFAAL